MGCATSTQTKHTDDHNIDTLNATITDKQTSELNNNEAKMEELEHKKQQNNTQNASKLNKEKEDMMMEYENNKLQSKLEALTIKMEQMEAKNDEFVKLIATNTLKMDEIQKETKRVKDEKKEIEIKYKEFLIKDNKMDDIRYNIYNEGDRVSVIEYIESGSSKEEEIESNTDREVTLDGIKSTLIWNERDSKWMKICKRSTIKMYQNNDGMDEWMVMVKDNKSDQLKFNHIIPNKDTANFKCDDNKFSCQWMAKNDLIQKENGVFTIFIKFASKQAFKTFIHSFQKLLI